MSTDADLKRCLADKTLLQLKAKLRPDQQPCRLIYITPQAASWLRENLLQASSDGHYQDAATPKEQLDAITRRFCAGHDLDPPLPKLMRPTADGIWRFRTPDLRAVGWSPAKAILIVSEIEFKKNCTRSRDNEMMLNARLLRKALGINNAEYVIGGFNDCF